MPSTATSYVYGKDANTAVVTAHAARTAAANCAYFLPRLLALAESNPYLRILDAGCGPGSITLDLARLLPPTATIVGIDFSGSIIERAKIAAADQGIGNVQFVEADVCALPTLFKDIKEHFDVVHTHQALSHFPDIPLALKSLLSVLKLGTDSNTSLLCMREAILPTRSVSSSSSVLSAALEASIDALIATSNLPPASPPADHPAGSTGLHLKRLLLAAGISAAHITFSLGTFCYSTKEEREGWGASWAGRCSLDGPPKPSEWAKTCVDAGIVSRERMKEFEKGWKQWVDDEAGVYGMLHGEVVAVKPANL